MNIISCGLATTIILGLAACATNRIDSGGIVSEYHFAALEARRTRAKVVIDYECNSACVIKLSSGSGLCVSKKAKFGVHEPRVCKDNVPYGQGTRDEKHVNLFKDLLPECAVKLFESKHAFDSSRLTYFTGEELLKSCPEIKECPDE